MGARPTSPHRFEVVALGTEWSTDTGEESCHMAVLDSETGIRMTVRISRQDYTMLTSSMLGRQVPSERVQEAASNISTSYEVDIDRESEEQNSAVDLRQDVLGEVEPEMI